MMLACALSLDAFVASFAYGGKKIAIPFKSVQVINLICGAITGVSLFVGNVVRQYIPEGLTVAICFTILAIMGILKLLDGITKSIIRKNENINKELRFSMLNFRFILHLYADPEDADVDDSKVLSPMEATSLAFALSLDGIAAGLGAAIGNVNGWAVLICSLFTNMAAVLLGCALGNKLARKTSLDLSWLCGVVLIGLAVSKLC